MGQPMGHHHRVETVEHLSGRTKVLIEENEGLFNSRMYVNGGETATNTAAKHQTMAGATKWAKQVMEKHHGK